MKQHSMKFTALVSALVFIGGGYLAYSVTELLGLGADPRANIAAISGAGSGLILHYTFDDGTASDSSGNGNTGTVSGAASVSGQIGQALSFDGTDDIVTIADPASGIIDFGTGSFSYAFWVNSPTSATEGFFEKKNGGLTTAAGYMVQQVSSGSFCTLVTYLADGTNYVSKSTNVSVCNGAWRHVAVTIDRSAQLMYVYVDGSQVDSTDISTIGSVSNTYPLNLAKRGANFYAGSLDDVRIYDRALTSTEISELYAYTGASGGGTPPPSPVSGVCGSTQNSCTSGTFSDTADSGTEYLWQCLGSNGGSTASCSLPIPQNQSDTTPPAISSVATASVTSSSATISWTTDEISDTQIEYGLTTGYGSMTALSSSFVSSHAQTISSLSANTLYHYRVRSKDASGNQAVSGDYTFTTSAAAPSTYTLTVSRTGAGSGTVTGTGISCGSDCSESGLSSGTSITLTASAGTGSTFSGWSGGGCSGTGTCTVTVSSNASVSASFATASVSVSGDCAATSVRCVDDTSGATQEYSTVQACANAAQAGDTCLIYPGVYNERVTVASSGTAGSRLRFAGTGGSKPSVNGFELRNRNYVTIQGMRLTDYVRCANTSGSTESVTCDWIEIIDNDFDGMGVGMQITGNNILVSGNTFDNMLDDMIRQHGDRWVVRNNVVVGETDVNDEHMDFWQSFCAGNSNGNRIAASYALLENNTYADISGPNVHFSLINSTLSCNDAPTNFITRYNKIKNIGSGAITVDTNQQASGGRDSVAYNNTMIALVGGNPPSWNDYAPGIYSASEDSRGINNLFYDAMDPVGATGFYGAAGWYQSHNLYYDPGATMTFGGAAVSEVGAIKNQNPLFVSLAGTDVSLQAASPAINAGGRLTSVSVADSGSGTSLVVDDAYFFQDGWAGADPDWIAVGSTGNVAQISSINYSTNVITLSSSISRNDGDPIWLYRDSDGTQVLYGSAPDIGAFEYASGGSSPIPVNGLCSAAQNTCSAGTLSDIADSSTQYLWQCTGSNGGTTASCSANIAAPSDTTDPSISIASPSPGATISGTVTLNASASDNVGVVGVQWKLDGSDLGSELTTAPYSGSWNTVGVSNGSHTLVAVARDAAGNTRTSSSVTVVVSNASVSAPAASGGSSSGGGGGGSSSAVSAPPTGTFTPTVPQRPAVLGYVSPSSCSPTATSTYLFARNLSLGSSHPDVKALQETLNLSGYAVSASGPGSKGEETSYFGPATMRAVQKLQGAYKITPTGTVGSITRLVLSTLPYRSSSSCATSAPTATPSSSYTFTLPLDLGSTGPEVTALQTLLSSMPSVYPEGLVTGYFGSLTQKAVGRFQELHGLARPGDPAYGYVGPGTRGRLNGGR